jgi:hypothetical protein
MPSACEIAVEIIRHRRRHEEGQRPPPHLVVARPEEDCHDRRHGEDAQIRQDVGERERVAAPACHVDSVSGLAAPGMA